MENAGLYVWYCYETKKLVVSIIYSNNVTLSYFHNQNLALSILDGIYRKYKEEINYTLFRPLNTLSASRIAVFAM